MSIGYNLPKSSRFLQAQSRFTAVFNVPTPGFYDFNNQQITIIPLIKGSLYFLERINVGGTISEDIFLNAISVFPRLTLRRLIDGVPVFPNPLPIVNFIDNQEVNGWIYTDKSNESLIATLSGIIDQTADLVGIASVSIAVQYNMYEISDAAFIAEFRATGNLQSSALKGISGGPISQVFSVKG